ncbi:hypothetical protein E2P81_ATG09531 [Venturia nashicola]|uniref:Uncharacterized protein n=1 Tax=Venturia nashicola TaxID=86259 RepID=A0A4Z1NZF6_9PEZI|nr:hypothetical protein E6O75_ATG09738 [Venturia nashicola]TLD25874.1 hypothetical protein E2P81_ATG09531 [Venturia nashicola]
MEEPDRSTSGPPVKKFHFSELSSHVTTKEKVKSQSPNESKSLPRTKTIDKPVDLKKCKLYELTQYNCPVPLEARRGEKPTEILCTPFVRFFRKCAGGLTVETTEWDFMPEE